MTPAPAEYDDRCRAAVEAEGLPFLAPLVATSQGVPDFLKLTREYVKVTAPKAPAAPLPVYTGPPPATLEEGIALMNGIGTKYRELSEETNAAILAHQAEAIADAEPGPADQAPDPEDEICRFAAVATTREDIAKLRAMQDRADRLEAETADEGPARFAEWEIRGAVDGAMRDGRAVDVAALVAEWGPMVGGPERALEIITAAKDEAKGERAERERQVQADAAGAAFKAVDEAIEKKDLEDEARRILEHGDPIAFHRKAFAAIHSGDQEIGDVWLMAAMTQAAVTTAGIQPGFTGKKGSGKSSGTRAALHLHPREYVEDGSFSNMAHLYDDSLCPGTVFYSDDTALGLDKISMIKRAMTEYQTGIVHKTVNKVNGRNQTQRLTIPPRCVFGFSSVHTAGDSELRDRQYLISLSPTIEDRKKWLAFFLDRLAEGREEYPITREVLICREMIRQIKKQTFRVIVPFKDRLVFSDPEAARDIIMFMDFVQASAILHHLRREHTTGADGIVEVTATDDDFNIAVKIFKESDAVRKFKISKDERALLQWLAERPGIADMGLTEQEIVSLYGAGRTTVRNLLYGRPPANGDAGICNSVPGVYSQKETREGGRGRAMVNVIYVTGDVVPSVMDFKSFVILRPSKPDTPDTSLTRG